MYFLCFVKFLRNWLLPIILSVCVFILSSQAADNKPEPITEQKLKKYGLDHDLHKCLSVADGDTIKLEDLGSVRLIGVDTPEKNHPTLPVQFMSKEASDFTRQLCLGKNLRLKYDPYDDDFRGKYGRILGYVYLENGIFLQEKLLRNGLAIAYVKYAFDENIKAQFLNWEKEAQKKGIGFWKDGGMAEVNWILGQNHPMIKIVAQPNDLRELHYDNWALKSISIDHLGVNIEKLYAWIYEFSPRDLKKKLKEQNYQEKPATIKNMSDVMVFGMAHKNWGLLHGKYAHPRIHTNDLDKNIEQLFVWFAKYSKNNLEKVLLNNGYHIIQEDYEIKEDIGNADKSFKILVLVILFITLIFLAFYIRKVATKKEAYE
jgi:endonuclease YncB( thermonuclease family)